MTKPIEVEQLTLKGSDLIFPERNANEMNDKEFTKLMESIEKKGLVELPQVAQLDDTGKYIVVGGNHRARAWIRLYGKDEDINVVLDSSVIDEASAMTESVSMNIIKGNINPAKFTQLVNKLSEKGYDDAEIQAMMAMDKKEFEKLYIELTKKLPDDIKKALDKSKSDIKNVDDLSRILNDLFANYGNTLDRQYMFFKFGGQTHIMIECDKDLFKTISDIANYTSENNVSITNIMKKVFKGGVSEIYDTEEAEPKDDKNKNKNIE